MIKSTLPVRELLVLLCCIFSITIYAQQTFTLSGVVTDVNNGEKLTGANIFIQETAEGVVSDVKGFYAIRLPKGKYTISISYIGYEERIEKVNLKKDLSKNIRLSTSAETIDEIVITGEAEDHNIKSTEISVEKLSIREIEKIPVIMGETDIFKTIQLLPGITSIAEGRSGFIVRGSGIDQNLILMDGMPLYYSSHMQGLYSVFNSDAVSGLTVYKGGIPARFGGRGASVLDVRMRESGFEKYRANLSVGLITSKFSLEAPVVKNKLSVFVAGRSTKLSFGSLYDRIKRGRSDASSGKGGKGDGKDEEGKESSGKGGTTDGFTFFDPRESWFDLNAKVIYKINQKNSIFLSGYYGQDFAITVAGDTDWGNRAASIRWNHQYSSKLLSNTSLIHSRYYTLGVSGAYTFNSGISTNSFKQEFSWFPNDNNKIRAGITSEYQDFNHGGLLDNAQDEAGKFMPPMQGLESAIFIENDQKINNWLSAYYGLRFSMYHRLGPGDSFVFDEVSNEPVSSEPFSGYTDVMAFHHNLEPRLALTFLLNDKNSFKLSYNRNAQYLRLMTLGADITWYDIWMPSTENIDPMLTDQFAIGYFRNFLDNKIQLSAEAYYKNLTGAADFEDGLHNYLVNNLEAYVATGKGRSYGFEVSVEKPSGRFNGRISYNFGESDYQIDVINQGRWYPNRFDVTHSLSVIASYELFKNLTISSTFLFSTGRPVTLPEAYYYVSGVAFPFWEGRNKYRLPDYHRLDFGIKYAPDFLTIKMKKHNREIKPGLELSFYNVYNRRNVHTINYTNNAGGKGNENATQVFEPYGISTFGFMPSFQFHLKF